jgi:hypothetical protein
MELQPLPESPNPCSHMIVAVCSPLGGTRTALIVAGIEAKLWGLERRLFFNVGPRSKDERPMRNVIVAATRKRHQTTESRSRGQRANVPSYIKMRL